jgi:hypothetical protein
LPITFGVIRGCPKVVYSAYFFQVEEKFILELSALVVVYPLRGAIAQDKVVIELVCSGLG